jgi:hypothetical protein
MESHVLGRIHQLLATDAENTKHTPALMANLDAWALQAFDDTGDLFRRIITCLGDWRSEDADDATLQAVADRLGLSPAELIQRLRNGDADPALGDAAIVWERLGAYRPIKYVVLACQRYWAWGASDMMRLRRTSALGYLRLEVECVGLCKLFLEEPATAKKWLNIRTDRDGQRFFSETKGRIRAFGEQLQLQRAYEFASGSSQHVRLQSLVAGLRTGDGQLSLPDQEFDPDDAFSFHLAVAYFHRTQERVLAALGSILPDVSDSEWPGAMQQFSVAVGRLWAVLAARYPDAVRELEADD